MLLNQAQAEIVLANALNYLGSKYRPGFKCVDFVREVYRTAGVEIPLIGSDFPPNELIIPEEHLKDPPPGSLLFLRNKQEKRDRVWSHVVLVLESQRCIHCSMFAGEVIISSLEELLERYDFLPSLS